MLDNNVNERFDISNYKIDTPLITDRNKNKMIELRKDGIGEKIMRTFVELK